MRLLLVWILNALALLAVTQFMPSIQLDGMTTALIAAALIGLVNMLIKPILVILTLPITILSLGLFILVINGLLFYFVGHLIEGFHVKTLMAGILGALLYSVISWVLSLLVPDN